MHFNEMIRAKKLKILFQNFRLSNEMQNDKKTIEKMNEKHQIRLIDTIYCIDIDTVRDKGQKNNYSLYFLLDKKIQYSTW